MSKPRVRRQGRIVAPSNGRAVFGQGEFRSRQRFDDAVDHGERTAPLTVSPSRLSGPMAASRQPTHSVINYCTLIGAHRALGVRHRPENQHVNDATRHRHIAPSSLSQLALLAAACSTPDLSTPASRIIDPARPVLKPASPPLRSTLHRHQGRHHRHRGHRSAERSHRHGDVPRDGAAYPDRPATGASSA